MTDLVWKILVGENYGLAFLHILVTIPVAAALLSWAFGQ